MIPSNPLAGTFLHAIGGISASSCYLPSTRLKKWSWNTFWLVQASFAWIIMPLLLGIVTVPNFFGILGAAPMHSVIWAFLLGAAYGFGGLSFGLAIRHIGYSLTYTISIGISAVLGTIIPLLVFGGINTHFSRPGGSIVLTGMLISIVGVSLCGWAGFKKENDLNRLDGNKVHFNMLKGLFLAIIGGVLSGVFNVSLEFGQPIADLAAQNGAGQFQGNAKMIVSTSGCFVVNLIWFLIASIRQNTLKEFSLSSGISAGTMTKNALWSMLAGVLWSVQFLFYGLGHVLMGHFQFASWVLHMSMLIFFSYIIGVIMKEWRNVSRKTYQTLIVALLVLVLSFVITAYGSIEGEQIITAASAK
jgi:L-rhamnose-H+ transport protein